MELSKQCTKCLIIKTTNNFRKKKYYKYGVLSYCKDCERPLKKRDDKRYSQTQNGKNTRKKAVTKYFQSEHGHAVIMKARQKPERKQKEKAYYDYKRKTDLNYKLKASIRKRITLLLKLKNWNKTKTFNQAIGCSLEELKYHLEKQFTIGMTWENRGLKGWHIDHIIPLSSAKTKEEMYKLCHYTNLQPLWAKDNLSKNNKLEWKVSN